jgi:hypothetical protein
MIDDSRFAIRGAVEMILDTLHVDEYQLKKRENTMTAQSNVPFTIVVEHLPPDQFVQINIDSSTGAWALADDDGGTGFYLIGGTQLQLQSIQIAANQIEIKASTASVAPILNLTVTPNGTPNAFTGNCSTGASGVIVVVVANGHSQVLSLSSSTPCPWSINNP